MGNQVPGAERHDSLTPKKTRSQIITTSDGRRSKSSKKDGLYADEKLFENFESNLLLTLRYSNLRLPTRVRSGRQRILRKLSKLR